MKYFAILIFAAYLGANLYVFIRLWQMLPAGAWLRLVLVVFGVLAVAAIGIFFAFRGTLPVGIGSVVYGLGTAWMVVLLYLFMAVLIADLLPWTGLVERAGFLRSNYSTFFGILGLVALILVAGNLNYHKKRRVEFTVEVPQAPVGDKLKMVVISDLHLGYTIGPRELSRWVLKINAENPDVIVIAGDLIDTDVRPLYTKDMAAVLRRLDARHGVYMVPGNHEYISGLDASLEFLGTTGITVLKDSVVTVGGRLLLAGRDDRTNPRRKPLWRLLEGADRSLPLVVADHQPADLSEAVREGAALQVSGHTHRGQVWPFNWVTDRIYEDSHGLIDKDGTKVFVSSGLGIWGGKFRIGTVSEYVVIFI
ncbi:MAG: metallophosphoesterase [Rikenellaceae bacterium]|nr:metallophosphoesterase [Rikenellaceae bacterium]